MAQPTFDVVIPARLGSTRLPGKVLADIHGKPLIAHVVDRAREAGARDIVVATDSERVCEACHAIGADVQLTSPGEVRKPGLRAEARRRPG